MVQIYNLLSVTFQWKRPVWSISLYFECQRSPMLWVRSGTLFWVYFYTVHHCPSDLATLMGSESMICMFTFQPFVYIVDFESCFECRNSHILTLTVARRVWSGQVPHVCWFFNLSKVSLTVFQSNNFTFLLNVSLPSWHSVVRHSTIYNLYHEF